jgi:hypothetical protein
LRLPLTDFQIRNARQPTGTNVANEIDEDSARPLWQLGVLAYIRLLTRKTVNVAYWPTCEVPTCASNVCSRGNCGLVILMLSFVGHDPDLPPAVHRSSLNNADAWAVPYHSGLRPANFTRPIAD